MSVYEELGYESQEAFVRDLADILGVGMRDLPDALGFIQRPAVVPDFPQAHESYLITSFGQAIQAGPKARGRRGGKELLPRPNTAGIPQWGFTVARVRRCRACKLVMWETFNDPIPPGYTVQVKDGDEWNFTLYNLELAETSKINHNHVETKPTKKPSMRSIVKQLRKMGKTPKDLQSEWNKF